MTEDLKSRNPQSAIRNPKSYFDPITLEILWRRLVSIVDEADASVARTAYHRLDQRRLSQGYRQGVFPTTRSDDNHCIALLSWSQLNSCSHIEP